MAFEPGQPIAATGSNYLQAIDLDGLADWAAKSGARIRLRVRPGDFVPVHQPVADISPARDDASEVLQRMLTFGRQQTTFQDIEYSVRQLTEIAVRALSPGINDPFTAGSVLERLGDGLCRIVPRYLPTGAVAREGEIVVIHPVTNYDGMCDAMFHIIRQSASGSGFVLIRMLDVLTKVAEVERMTDRLASLRRHAELVLKTGHESLADQAAREDLDRRWHRFQAVADGSPESG